MCGLQIRFCLFTFWLIAFKKFKRLTTIDTLSWLGGPELTHPPCVQTIPGSIPVFGKFFMFDFAFCYCCIFNVSQSL